LHQDHPEQPKLLRCNGSDARARRDSNPQPSDPYGTPPASTVTAGPSPDHSSILAISISRHEPRHGDRTVLVRPWRQLTGLGVHSVPAGRIRPTQTPRQEPRRTARKMTPLPLQHPSHTNDLGPIHPARARHRPHYRRRPQPSTRPQTRSLDSRRPRLRGPAHRHAKPVHTPSESPASTQPRRHRQNFVDR